MVKEKTIGKCALCRKTNVELMKSHIIPKAIYRRTKTYENARFRNFFNPNIIYQDGEKKPLLCHECEEFFSKYEMKFSNLFLDRYLASPSSPLPAITKDIEFYIITVAWRILYDDLYKQNSYKGDSQRIFFEEYEEKLGKYIFEKYIEENPTATSTRTEVYKPNMNSKCFGEMIAEFEKWEKSSSPEDMSEIKNYIHRLSDLGFEDTVKELFDSMIFGYSFCDSTRTKYYIISGYKGLIITTAFLRKRSILINNDRRLFVRARKVDKMVKKDIRDEITYGLMKIRNEWPKLPKKLDENGLKYKIKRRYEGK